ncbi:MAG: EamA family transporter [Pseudomonadota bacterium]
MTRFGPALNGAAFLGLSPVVTAAGERLLLGTSLSWLQWLGVALVVTGAVLLARRL